MMQRTYAVFGLMEYTINVMLGSRQLKIPFTDGIASKDGVRPATYTTSNPVVQFAIESSKHFKSGRVKILKTVGKVEADPLSVSEAKAAKEKASAKAVATAETTAAAEETAAAKEQTDAPSTEENATDENSDNSEEASSTEKASGEVAKVQVACYEDARQYLIDNCDGKAKNLRSKKAVAEYAEQHNIVFEYPDE